MEREGGLRGWEDGEGGEMESEWMESEGRWKMYLVVLFVPFYTFLYFCTSRSLYYIVLSLRLVSSPCRM
jgi:hypothetical protein